MIQDWDDAYTNGAYIEGGAAYPAKWEKLAQAFRAEISAAGRAERGGQLATLEGIRHAMLVSDRLGDLVEEVAAQSEGNERLARELALPAHRL